MPISCHQRSVSISANRLAEWIGFRTRPVGKSIDYGSTAIASFFKSIHGCLDGRHIDPLQWKIRRRRRRRRKRRRGGGGGTEETEETEEQEEELSEISCKNAICHMAAEEKNQTENNNNKSPKMPHILTTSLMELRWRYWKKNGRRRWNFA